MTDYQQVVRRLCINPHTSSIGELELKLYKLEDTGNGLEVYGNAYFHNKAKGINSNTEFRLEFENGCITAYGGMTAKVERLFEALGDIMGYEFDGGIVKTPYGIMARYKKPPARLPRSCGSYPGPATGNGWGRE
ncbi:hypothetical protein ACFL96_07150 [Thermoproteota archaeon]